jgi:hypothetical protein
MATYTPGDNEDHVIKTTETDQDLDLTVFIEKFQSLKQQLQDIPVVKTVPDQEILDHWNSYVVEEGERNKVMLDSQAVELYNEATAIKNAGLLPSKYDAEYQQLEDYVNSL